ncbi:protein translocase subunit SecF [Nocardioides bizhenqiangii]|uniref:Protein-export membrane protein SecF n=1 Tax=Nocardioides bizhenqiangii TaxID=3095076 RepID=A0ABZ0ZWW4_9ACTN|nr:MULTISPECIES: protein translocase subunit SecF [unclassified Nocardioides]MDZ5622218.1 protein translocase subunit SecF [Nocardioides sp. HM23]WQQ28605.1 protein translocase subunit SecF [Nocardioides sp. HM61]
MGKMSRLGNDLYNGEKSIDFMGHRALWYGFTLLLVGLAITAVIVKPLNFGVEFRGGTEQRVTVEGGVDQADADDLREAIADAGIENAENPSVTTAGPDSLVLTTETLSETSETETEAVILEMFPSVDPTEDISVQEVGPSWGQEVAERALIGIAVFLVLVILFIWFYFREWKMSVAAMVALTHDLAVTIGIYALSGFQVTPAAVTGLLAILGFSLYDTVVVFDKIKENTTTLRKSTESYHDAANLAVNQTLVRSINTSIVALIPIGAILYVSAVQLGASSLQDLALAQFVGMAAGVYSSVMLAPRVLVHLKSSETEVVEQARRARARKRALADKYASVPAVRGNVADTPDTPGVVDDRPARPAPVDVDEEPGEPARPSEEALGKGRVAPTAQRKVAPSSSSGRQQPVRQARSKRGKK